tara:strand:- start:3145 stop:5916 length:2772 start_codon:yes stop_codon:yes gene_type:complete
MMKKGFFLSCILGVVLIGCGEVKLSDEELFERAHSSFESENFRSSITDLKTLLQSQPQNPQARELLAIIYLQLNDGASAEAVLLHDRSVSEMPESSAVLLAESYYLQAKGDELFQIDLDQFTNTELLSKTRVFRGMNALSGQFSLIAKEEFSEAKQLSPSSVLAELGLARIDALEGDIEQAQARVEAILERDPSSVEALLLAGEQRTNSEDYSSAYERFSQVLLLEPNHLMALYRRSLVLIKLDRVAESKSDVSKLEKYYGRDNIYSVYSRGMVSFASGDFRTAAESLDQVLLYGEENYPAIYYSALAHYQLGETEVSSQLLNKFLLRYPDSTSAKRILASSLLRSGNPDDAEDLILEVLDEQADDVFSLNTLGVIYNRKGMHKENLKIRKTVVNVDSEDIESYRNLADAYAKTGDDENSILALLDVVDHGESSEMDKAMLVKAYLKVGDIANASKHANEMLESAPESINANLMSAAVYFESGNYQRAKEYFNKTLSLEKGNPPASSGLAAIAMKEGSFGVAEDYYEDSLKHYPKDLQILFNLAIVEDYLGKRDEAESHLKSALEYYPENMSARMKLVVFYRLYHQYESVDRVLSSPFAASDPLGDSLLIDAKMVLGDNESAKTLLVSFLDKYPNDLKARYSLAMVNYRLGESEEYRKSIEELSKNELAHPNVIKELVKIQIFDRDYNAAANSIERLYSKVGDRSDVFALRGDLSAAKSNFGEAVSNYRNSFSLDNNNIALVKLSSALWKLGEHSDSIALMEDWLGNHPDDNVIAFDLANRYLMNGDDEKSIQLFKSVVEADPDNVIVLNNLAWLMRSSEPKQSVEYAARAVALAPNSGTVKDTYAMALLSSGDLSKAKYFSDKARELDSNNKSIALHRAIILNHLGDKEEARVELISLLESEVEFGERQEAESLLREIEGKN